MKKLLVLFAFLFAIACVTKPDKPQQDEQTIVHSSEFSTGTKYIPGRDTIKLPVTITAGEPSTIHIPETGNGTYTRKTKSGEAVVVKLVPPIIHPASSPNSPIGLPHFTTYNTEQGLALSGARCIYEDQMGNMWFGTEGGGVSRYDGKSFTNFTTTNGLPSNSVWCIKGDKKGNVWFGTIAGGISRYDGKSFTNFTKAQGFLSNTIWNILQDKKGNLWFATEDGISMYDGKSFINYTTAQGLTNNKVRSALQDKNGNLWFSTLGGGISKYDGRSFTNYTTVQGLASNNVNCSCEDKAGNLWFGLNENGVSRYDGTSFINFTTAQGLAGNKVWCITEDKTGNIWLGTENGGASKYDGNSFTNYTTTEGLSNNNVYSIVEDKTGSLWLGTESGGVNRYDGQAFMNFTTAQGLADNIVMGITEDRKGNLWFATYGGGVSKYDRTSFTNYSMAQGLAYNNTFCITEDKKGNIWFGTEGGGANKFDGKSFTNYTTAQGLLSDVVLGILEDKAGNLWFGTYSGGLSRYDGKSFTNFTTAQGLASNNVFCMLEDKTGNLWFGTVGGGVSKYDGKSFTNYTTAQGLPNNTIWNIMEDEIGNLWFGTATGLSQLVMEEKDGYDTKLNRENDRVKFTNYSISNGLPDNFITNVLELPNKKIVVGTNKGIAVFNPAKPTDEKERLAELEIYNIGNGYPVKDVNAGQHPMYLDSKNILWVATGDEKTAVTRIDYDAINRHINLPTVVIQKIMINDKDICWYDLEITGASNKTDEDSMRIAQQEMITYGKLLSIQERKVMKQNYGKIKFDSITAFYPLPQQLVLPYESNNVSFEFNAIEPGRAYLANYQYMLEGYDKDWSPIVQKTSASFGNISEGTYTFKLKAQNSRGIWSEPVIYTFKVLPQWYRTWWAYTFYIIIIVGVFYSLFRWRTASFVRERELLEEKVKIRTEQLVKQTEVAESQRMIADTQREIAETQKLLLQEKAKEITDSIHYAKRIQTALLTSLDYITEHMPAEHFILFKPKDIVSGDFYWALQHQNKFYLATCDCTGHGVPGAFMSMLNISFLNEAILERGITEPHKIINRVRDEIIAALNPRGSKEVSKDGMDAVLCSYDFKHMKLTFSSANNVLWLVRNNELIEYKGDKMPIGKYNEEMSSFTLQTINLMKGDVIYTSTDGFADQLGMNEKKLMKKNLKEQLLSIHNKPMAEQKDYLEAFFEKWKGDIEQTDDVCIIGVRI
jgi:ligand-binding sensor domain-containing protein/serine phosphatase RsbU (regulator of sigma subunit)